MDKKAAYGVMTFNMMIWGLNTVALKVLVAHFPPLAMQSLRIFVAGLILVPFLLVFNQWRKMSGQEWNLTLGAALFGVLGHHSLLAMGLEKTTASHAALILALNPLATSLLAFFLLKDRLTLLRCLGIVFGLTGVSFVVLNGSEGLQQGTIGDLYILASMASQALSFIFIKKATDTLDAKQMTSVMFLLGSLMILTVAFFTNPVSLPQMIGSSPWIWTIFFGSAVIATGLGHLIYNSAIHRLGPGQTAIFINMTPFFALTGSIWLLGEAMAWTQAFGFLFICTGVFLGSGALDGWWTAIWTGFRLSRKQTDCQ
ncbi:DMT family transporter [Salinithrix halophila]|uniref:DMT family transporter n=1 Tax=Salinithrix halophila TaxID=1485204 RepID=A0ABV8JAF3_9BACL